MSRPTIRHIALFARDPEKLAEFYRTVFKMDVLHQAKGDDGRSKAFFMSDGYLKLALLPHRLDGEAAHGLNHFGFDVESTKDIAQSIVALGGEEPLPRPATRPFAE